MNNILGTQIVELFHFCIAGIEISILFDLFRAKRRAIKTSDITTCIEDIGYWIIVGFVLTVTIAKYTNGEIRGYMIIGLIIGVIVYFYFFSKLIIKLFVKIFDIILFPIKKFNKLIKKY